MVTAKTAEIDTVVGLEVGADDYVTKPYRLRELVARMRAVLRRQPRGADTMVESHDVLRADGIVLDTDSHEVRVRGELVSLPLKEFELLALLMENVGRVLPRATLIDRVWGSDYVGDTKTLDVHVKRLRSKIEDDPSQPSPDRDDPRAWATSSPALPPPPPPGPDPPGPGRRGVTRSMIPYVRARRPRQRGRRRVAVAGRGGRLPYRISESRCSRAKLRLGAPRRRRSAASR